MRKKTHNVVSFYVTLQCGLFSVQCLLDMMFCKNVVDACMVRIYCREVGLEPTGDTLTVLMCGFAEKGDISAIEKVGCVTHWLVQIL